MDIAQEIRGRRQGLGLSQFSLAVKVGVTPHTIARWEAGQSPNSRYLKALASALKCRTEELIK